MEEAGVLRIPSSSGGLWFWGCPAGEPDEPGGFRGADAEEAHDLPTGQRAAVTVQFGDEVGVGAVTVHVNVVWLVRQQCSGLGAGRCTGGCALQIGWCSACLLYTSPSPRDRS